MNYELPRFAISVTDNSFVLKLGSVLVESYSTIIVPFSCSTVIWGQFRLVFGERVFSVSRYGFDTFTLDEECEFFSDIIDFLEDSNN